MTRPGINPCLLCRELTRGPKGGVVCDTCRHKVEHYDEIRDRNLQGRTAIQLPNYPFMPGASGRNSKSRNALEGLLRELRTVLPKPAERTWYQTHEGETAPQFEGTHRFEPIVRPRDTTTYNVPAELAQFLVDIEPAIQHALKESEADGKSQGSNLLAQLAAGELTSADFEHKAGITPGERA